MPDVHLNTHKSDEAGMLGYKVKKPKLSKSDKNQSMSRGNENSIINCKNSNHSCPVKRKRVESLGESDGDVAPKQIAPEGQKIRSNAPAHVQKKSSKRQMKRERAEQREAILKDKSRSEATEKALEYISKWKHSRNNWKFEKLRQIWLMDHILEEKSIPDTIFPIVLEYFEGCKGMAREQLIKKGMDIIKKAEDEESKDEVIKSVAYIRARQLIQVLPTKT